MKSSGGHLQGALAPIKTKHRAATTDPKEVAPLLRMLDSYQGSLIVRCALRLLPLLFVRPGELRSMQWADVHFEKSEWSFMVNKTKTPHIVPLSKQAGTILREIHPLTGNGFRAMARTILDEVLGFRPDFIEQQLAHAVRDPLGRAYNRTAYLPERKKMMQAWADYLDILKSSS